MNFTEIHIQTTEKSAPAISEELSEFGAVSVTFLDAADNPIFEPSKETTILWKKTIVIGLFDQLMDLSPLLKKLKTQNNFEIFDIKLKNLPDEDWVKKSLDSFKPMKFGKHLWICPSWIKPPEPKDINIILDPGQAFGTGSHPTTALCLEWLEKNVNKPIKVTDYGAGSGILGLAALKLGAKHVTAIDIDRKSLEITTQNMLQNNIQPIEFNTFLPDNAPMEESDLVIANILQGPLIELAPKIKKLTKPLGKIILSGILREQVDSIRAAYKQFFCLQPVVFKEEWGLVEGIRTNNI